MQVEHQVSVPTDELPDFIDQEDDAVILALLVEILLHPLAKILDSDGEVVFRLVDPLFGSFFALAGGGTPGFDDLIVIELVGIPLLLPR